MKKIIFFVSLMTLNLNAQTIKIDIKDAKTSEPLPYASVRLLNSKQGFYTNEQGNGFIENLDLNDTLKISYVGYYEKILPIKLLGENGEILLEQKGFTLNEVVVKNDILVKKPCYLGIIKEPTNMNFYFGRNVVTEFAAKIEIPEDIEYYRVLKVVVAGVIRGKNNNPIRLHLYDDNNGSPGNELLTKDLLADNKIILNGKKLEIDISQMSIKSNDRILYVGIEAIITTNSNKKDNITDFDQGAYFTTKISKELTFARGLKSPQWFPYILRFREDKNPCNLKAGIQIQELKN